MSITFAVNKIKLMNKKQKLLKKADNRDELEELISKTEIYNKILGKMLDENKITKHTNNNKKERNSINN